MRRALLSLLVVMTALGLTAAACGRDSTDSAIEIVAAAASKTSAAGTSRMSLVADVTQPGGAVQQVTAEGAIDYVGHKGRLTMDLGSLGGDLKGKIDVLLVADIVYVKLPTGDTPVAKPWLRVAAGDEGSGGFGVFGASDPSGALAALSGAGAVTKVGSEEVRGTPTDHYTATVDLKKAAAKSGARAADVERLDAALDGETIPMDVWVDSEGRARRLQMVLEQSVKTTLTVEFYDFGVEVDAEPPPPSQVADISGLTPPPGQAG